MCKIEYKYCCGIDENSQLAIAKVCDDADEIYYELELNDYDENIYKTIHHDTIRAQWLTIRLMIKELLGDEKHIIYDDCDKPHLSDKSYFISISHIKGFVAVLISKDKHAGIDIETRDERIRRIIYKFLNKEELESVEKENDIDKYLLYWNAKEALYKLYGRKSLIFKENILLSSFVLKNEGVFAGKIVTTDYKEDFEVNYKIFDKFTLAWSLK